jgi:hypothetical protein
MDEFDSPAEKQAAIKDQQETVRRLMEKWFAEPYGTPEHEAARRAYNDAVDRVNEIYRTKVREK